MLNKPYLKEEKIDRFARIAQQRTNRVLNALRLLGNTANRNTYKYNDEQIDKIFSVIESKLIETRGKFRRSREEKFEL